MTWEIGMKTGETGEDWEFSGDYPDPQSAIVALTMQLGVALAGNLEGNGMWSVKRCDDSVIIAVIRERGAIVGKGEAPEHMGPLRRWRGLTWVGWLNTLVLQFLGVRLTYHVEKDNTISGWGFCFAWPFARKVGRYRRLTRHRTYICNHGVTFDERQWEEAYRRFKADTRGMTDQVLLNAVFTHEVRRRWPRLDGKCPKGCGYEGICYASTAHYVAGDW
jgi:hypothetical protein